jgi:Ni,Fe-hydrogenase III large subunit
VAPVVPAVHWDEREIHDLLGLEPRGHPDLRRLALHDDWPAGRYPLRKDFDATLPPLPPVLDTIGLAPAPDGHQPRVHGDGVMEVPVGPIHAGIIEPGHFRFSTIGERILHLDARLFFTHRGLEKSAEGLTVERALFVAERLCGVCSAAHAVAYCQAVEALAGLGDALPARAAYVRAVALELERLYNHIGDVGNVCAGVGFAAGAMHGARLREALLRLNETVLGHRYLRGVCMPGGVRRNLSARYAEGLARELHKLRREFHQFCALLGESDSLQERLLGTGVLPREAALALGVTGVAARASGVDLDVRRDLPYGAYAWHADEFAAAREGETRRPWPVPREGAAGPWRVGPSPAAQGLRGVPVYDAGDVRARVQVRIDEAECAFNLLFTFLEALREQMPAEPVEPLHVPLGPLPAFAAGIGWAESPRGANVHGLMTDSDGRVFRYHVRSSSFANWPAVALTAPGNMLPDFPLINKSFELCYSCCDR